MRVLRSALAFVAMAGLSATFPTEEAHATEIGTSNPFGLGVVLGYPGGISGKYYLGGRKNAIEGVLGGWANLWGASWYLHGVYMWHPSTLTSQPAFELPWHVGVGAFVSDDYRGFARSWDDDFSVGARAQIGLDFDLAVEHVPLQFSADLAMNVGVMPAPFLSVHPSITARYYF